MRVIKPAWVEHTGGEKKKKCPVYSLSVHPDGTRLATGGLDRKIKIWSTLPILDPEADKIEANHKLLCTMSEHTGSVLAVRWAHHGRFLASGSDDQVAMIWGLDPDGGGRLWGSDEVNVENWKPLTRLVGHVADIIDMAWSRDDSMLASVGLDSTVWIWDGHTFERLRKLDKHQGFVKGVCWDPVGNYLATQSDDKTVKIWNADTWELVKSVSEPFANSGHATFFRRLSWSPDGAFIAASNAKNGPVFVAAVIDREGWTSEISFVGHSNTIQVAAFNPRLFFNQNEVAARSTASCMLALGADDFSISIWRNTLHTPIVVLHNIFEHSLLDLCWSNDGHHLYGSSEDGTICAISFDDDEVADLGTPEMTEDVLKEYNYKPSRRIARPIPAATPQVANGFGTSTTSSTAVNVLQARKAKPGDERRRFERNRPTLSNTAGPSRAPLGAPALPNHSVFDGPIQDGFTSPSQAQASTQRMFRDADTAFGGNMSPTKAGKRKASIAFDEGPRGRMMGSSGRNMEVREIRAPRVSTQTGSSSSSVSRRLPLPTIQTLLRATSGSVYLEARNASTPAEKNQVVYNRDGTDVWVDFVESAVVVLAVSEKCAAVGCEDGTLYIYSTAGRHLSSFKLASTPVDLSANGHTVAILTADTEIRIISSKTGRTIGLPASCSHLLESTSPSATKNIDISGFTAYINGSCSIVTSEPSVFLLDPALSAWTPLFTPPSSLPDLKRLLERSPRGPLYIILSDLLTSFTGKSSVKEKVDTPEWYEEAITMKYLESNLKAAEILGSGEEWGYWVEKYIEVLGKEGFTGRADEVNAELMGPVYRRDDSGWKDHVGGTKKRDVLTRILGIMNQYGSMAELVSQYRAILRMASAADEEE